MEVEVMSCYGDGMYAFVNCNNACMHAMQMRKALFDALALNVVLLLLFSFHLTVFLFVQTFQFSHS